MQTSKIKIGETYAVKQGGLKRFHVRSITTVRSANGVKNKVTGFYFEDEARRDTQVDPEDVIDSYDKFAELKERKAQEDAKRNQEQAERKSQALKDRAALYDFVGLPMPQKADDYHQHFRVASYGGDVDITSEGAKAIIARVHERKAKLTVVK